LLSYRPAPDEGKAKLCTTPTIPKNPLKRVFCLFSRRFQSAARVVEQLLLVPTSHNRSRFPLADQLMNAILFAILFLLAVYGAWRAMLSTRLLPSVLWLACVSASVSIILYLLGATQVAVIELSVGAGLVTVLLVYAISVTGDDAYDPASIIPKPLAFGLVLASILMLGWMAFSLAVDAPPEAAPNLPAAPLSAVLWEDRVLDVWVQIVLIFSGVMGLMGLLAEGKTRLRSGLDTLHQVMGKNLVQTPTDAESTREKP
jgi:NADH:ubiquinone oxidoreductase subunit 6 (subunit J)